MSMEPPKLVFYRNTPRVLSVYENTNNKACYQRYDYITTIINIISSKYCCGKLKSSDAEKKQLK